MTEYFSDALVDSAKKQRNKNLAVYITVAAVFLIITVVCFVLYALTPYGSNNLSTIKIIHYALTVVFVAFSFLYLFVPYKRIARYYKKLKAVKSGRREVYEGRLKEKDESKITKDFVEFKSMLFVSENKDRGGLKERKVEIFYDDAFPDIDAGDKVKLTLCGNLLINYEITEKGVEIEK